MRKNYSRAKTRVDDEIITIPEKHKAQLQVKLQPEEMHVLIINIWRKRCIN